MTKILRYELTGKVMLHEGAVLLDAAPDSTGKLQGWFLSDTTKAKEPRYFMAYATGVALPEDIWDARHVLSIKGSGMMHIFERTIGQMNASKATGGKGGE